MHEAPTARTFDSDALAVSSILYEDCSFDVAPGMNASRDIGFFECDGSRTRL